MRVFARQFDLAPSQTCELTLPHAALDRDDDRRLEPRPRRLRRRVEQPFLLFIREAALTSVRFSRTNAGLDRVRDRHLVRARPELDQLRETVEPMDDRLRAAL